MCTLVMATRAWPGLPLLVAANRDEQLDRPSLPPRRWEGPFRGDLVAPVDARAGGTWLGINRAGMFAGITNRWVGTPDASRRSRGELVLEALAAASVEGAVEGLRLLDPHAYNPFHLMVADPGGAALLWHDGSSIRVRTLNPGIHVLTERSLGAATSQREHRVRSWVDEHWRAPPDDLAVRELLSRHGDDPLESPCVHVADRGYGTRSSTIIRLPAGPEPPSLLHAEGPPCMTPHQDLSRLLQDLFST
jgi:uncharacterized protein with NRDE domain